LRYQALRRLPGDGFEQLPPGRDLAAGDTVKLRFEPNAAGYLLVQEMTANRTRPPLLTTAVERFGSAETREIRLENPGVRRFLVTFTRQGAANGAGGAINPASLRTDADAGERTTYVVDAGADPKSPVSFTVTLTWK
jgi:hypothetical protein